LEENPTWFGLGKNYKFVGSPYTDLRDVHNAIKRGYIRLTVSGYKNLNIQIDSPNKEAITSIRNLVEFNPKYKLINVEDINGRSIAEGNVKQVLAQLNGRINNTKVEPKSAAQWHLEGDSPFGVLGPVMLTGSLIGAGALAGNINNAYAGQNSLNKLAIRNLKKVPVLSDKNAIKTIIGEAENQGLKGMQDIASVIRNRGTLQGAYGYKSPRVVNKKYSKEIYKQAKIAWENSRNNNTAGGANHWFSESDLKQAKVQKMVKNMTFIKKSGSQSLYKE